MRCTDVRAGGIFETKQRTIHNKNWYLLQPEADMGNHPVWVPASSLSMVGPGCYLARKQGRGARNSAASPLCVIVWRITAEM